MDCVLVTLNVDDDDVGTDNYAVKWSAITAQKINKSFPTLYENWGQSQINRVAYDSIEAGLLQIRGLLLKLKSNIINYCTKHSFKY